MEVKTVEKFGHVIYHVYPFPGNCVTCLEVSNAGTPGAIITIDGCIDATPSQAGLLAKGIEACVIIAIDPNKTILTQV